MNDPYSELNSKTFDANLQIMPINDLRIDLKGMSRLNRNFLQAGYHLDVDSDPTNGFTMAFENELLTYSKSTWMFKTAFKGEDEVYRTLRANAQQLSQQKGGNILADGFAEGYSLGNSYILIPAFRAAVEGKAVEDMGNPTKVGIPLPNWNVTYSGLRNIPLISYYFAKFDVLHSYNSTYTGSGVQSNIDYYNSLTTGDIFDVNGDRINPYVFSTVGYVESFAPLIGADVTMRNNMQFRAQYNKDRLLMLGLVNNTLTEDYSTEYLVGFGYILKDFKMKINVKGKSRTIKSDLNFRGDFSLRDSKTKITNILLDDSQVSGGQRLLGIKLSADYNMSENFNLRIFYDQLMTKYKISTAFPLSTIRAGITATFNFGGSGF